MMRGRLQKKIKEGFTWLGVVQEGFPPMARGSRGIIPVKLFLNTLQIAHFGPPCIGMPQIAMLSERPCDALCL